MFLHWCLQDHWNIHKIKTMFKTWKKNWKFLAVWKFILLQYQVIQNWFHHSPDRKCVSSSNISWFIGNWVHGKLFYEHRFLPYLTRKTYQLSKHVCLYFSSFFYLDYNKWILKFCFQNKVLNLWNCIPTDFHHVLYFLVVLGCFFKAASSASFIHQ